MITQQLYLTWLQYRLQRFIGNARRARSYQHATLFSKIRRNATSEFGREHGLATIRTLAEFRKQVPVMSYEDHDPYIQRVLHGENSALFGAQSRVLMFAMTSGTTGEPKRLPITDELFREYRRGWLTWAAGTFGDHRQLMNLKTLQLTSDWQVSFTPSGIPCGQISGLAATTRPRIAQQMFLPPPATARIHDSTAKHYTTLRIALASRKVGMIITANPSTLVEFARRANEERESLIRDIHDGTLSCDIPTVVRNDLEKVIVGGDPQRARELTKLAEKHDALMPRHVWPELMVLAVWTGGSVGVFLPQLAQMYGDATVRDHGLSASEGRMSIPLKDGASAGVLDYYHHFFEFIPVEERESKSPIVLEGHELEVGRDYYILMTTSGGLYRYDIHDVVRCVGFEGEAPLIEFLNKGKHFSNITGEKLSEHQVIRAVEKAFQDTGLLIDTFTLAPVVGEYPRYVLLIEKSVHGGRANELAAQIQRNLRAANEEYASKCDSGRLLPVQVCEVPTDTWKKLRKARTSRRGNFEEYKHPCLVDDLNFAQQLVQHSAEHASQLPQLTLADLPLGGISSSTTRV